MEILSEHTAMGSISFFQFSEKKDLEKVIYEAGLRGFHSFAIYRYHIPSNTTTKTIIFFRSVEEMLSLLNHWNYSGNWKYYCRFDAVTLDFLA